MTYSVINKCAKNYYNRTFIVPVIAKNVVTCFFLRHSVDYCHTYHSLQCWSEVFFFSILPKCLFVINVMYAYFIDICASERILKIGQ